VGEQLGADADAQARRPNRTALASIVGAGVQGEVIFRWDVSENRRRIRSTCRVNSS
jgi:hypothetical protein